MLCSSVVLIALIGVVFWAFAKMLSMFYNLLVPLSVAGILALVLFPVVEFLQRRLRIRRVLAVTLLFAVFAVAFSAFIVLIVPTVMAQVVAFAEAAPEMLETFQKKLNYHFPILALMISARIENGAFEGLALSESEGMGKVMVSFIGLLGGLGFVPLYLFFALLSGGHLRGRAEELLSVFSVETRNRALYFIDVFVGYVTAFFQGQLVIATIMGAMYAVGFTLVGLELAIPIGLILGLLNVVPFLGTLIGILLVMPMAYLQADGGIAAVLLTLVVFATVQLIESWALTPRIMANRSGLPPVLVVISVFFWGISLGGVVGMILAVPLTAFFVAIWSQIKAALTRSLNPSSNYYVRLPLLLVGYKSGLTEDTARRRTH